jgi:hypothetical protein
MALNLVKTVADFLRQRSEEKFKARHMAQWIFETFPAECHEKKSKSTFIKTDEQLIQQLVAELVHNDPIFKRIILKLKRLKAAHANIIGPKNPNRQRSLTQKRRRKLSLHPQFSFRH